MHGVAVRQNGGDQVKGDRQTAALPVAHRQHAPGFLDLGGVGGQLALFVVAAGNGQLHTAQAAVLDFAVAELADRAVDHRVLTVGARHCHDKRVVADFAVLAAPCGHVGHRVRPADTDAAVVGCQPAVGTAAHPVVVVAQRHNADAVLLGKLAGTVHSTLGVQRTEATVAVPALNAAHARHAGGAGGGVDFAFFQIADDAGEAVQTVAEHTRQAVLRKDDGGILRVRGGKAFLFQHAGKLGDHFFIRYTFHFTFSFVFVRLSNLCACIGCVSAYFNWIIFFAYEFVNRFYVSGYNLENATNSPVKFYTISL